jgi:hypothetical protein
MDPVDVTALEDEIRHILKDLCAETGAVAASVTADDGRTGVPARTLPLGGKSFLRVELPTRSRRGEDTDAAIERAARAIRAAGRRWETDDLPEVSLGPGRGTPAERARERVVAYLQALAAIQHGQNALVIHRGRLLASARPPAELEEARWPFIARRALAAAERARGSSHADLADPDFYASTFWYGAVLVVYFAAPYATDFVRHRARLVSRELARLLPGLEPDPDPAERAAQRPRP